MKERKAQRTGATLASEEVRREAGFDCQPGEVLVQTGRAYTRKKGVAMGAMELTRDGGVVIRIDGPRMKEIFGAVRAGVPPDPETGDADILIRGHRRALLDAVWRGFSVFGSDEELTHEKASILLLCMELLSEKGKNEG